MKRADMMLPAIAAVAAAVASAFAAPAVAQSIAQPPGQARQELRYAQGVILVAPKAGLGEKELDKLLDEHGGKRDQRWRELGVQIVRIPKDRNPLEVAARLARNPNIKYAQPDMLRKLEMTPNDPSYAAAWHHARLNTPTAWDRTQGEGITIAVCDTGVDPNHPDLVRVPGFNTYDANTDSRDVHGHGTKVAGAIAMAGNNGIGGAGVAFRTRIMPIRVSDPSGWAFDSAIANCITWAADNGARGANASYAVCGSPIVQSAAKYMRDRGGVVTVSSGNAGAEQTIVPSDLLTCVGATDSADNRASWSNYGTFVDVVAPGDNIYTTSNGGGYGGASGTSFAAPVTLGVYALMMAANPRLTAAQLDSILFSTAKDLGAAGKDNLHGYGRVDAAAAVAKAASLAGSDVTPPAVSIAQPLGGAKVSGIVAVDVAATDAGGVAKVDLYVNGKLVSTDTISPYGFAWDTGGLPDGAATLVAKAVDAAGNIGTSTQVSVTVANDKVPPVAQILSPAPGATVTGTVNISASATDNQRVAKITMTIDGREVAVAYGSSISYAWNAGANARRGRKATGAPTTSTIVVIAEDTAGNRGTASQSVTRQ
jgi:subtilisin family serine protease